MHLWAGVPGEPCYIPNISWLHALATPPTQFRSIDLAWASRSYKRIEIHAHLRKHARTICYYDILWSHWHASELFWTSSVHACVRACVHVITISWNATLRLAWWHDVRHQTIMLTCSKNTNVRNVLHWPFGSHQMQSGLASMPPASTGSFHFQPSSRSVKCQPTCRPLSLFVHIADIMRRR